MPTIQLLRFSDLKEAQVVTSWPQLKRLVTKHGFPAGFNLSPAVRVWDAAEIKAWLDGRRDASSDLPPEQAETEDDAELQAAIADHEAEQRRLINALVPFADMNRAFAETADPNWVVFGSVRIHHIRAAYMACYGKRARPMRIKPE